MMKIECNAPLSTIAFVRCCAFAIPILVVYSLVVPLNYGTTQKMMEHKRIWLLTTTLLLHPVLLVLLKLQHKIAWINRIINHFSQYNFNKVNASIFKSLCPIKPLNLGSLQLLRLKLDANIDLSFEHSHSSWCALNCRLSNVVQIWQMAAARRRCFA